MHENQIVQRLLRTGLHHKQYMNEVGCCLNDRQSLWRLLAITLTRHLCRGKLHCMHVAANMAVQCMM